MNQRTTNSDALYPQLISNSRAGHWCTRRITGLAAVVCTILMPSTGCVGPVQDKVGTNFRSSWIASRAGLPTPYFDYPETEGGRNEFIDDFVAVKNIQFHNYVAAIRRGAGYGNLTADGSRLILDGLAATTGGVALKAGLAAASAGITGFAGSVKKDLLFDQALPSFIEKMEELRANKLADITLKKKLSIEEYSRSEAFNDVEEFGADGTFDAALRALNVQTGQATAKAKADLSMAKGDIVSAAAASATSTKSTGSQSSSSARPTPVPKPLPSTQELMARVAQLTDEQDVISVLVAVGGTPSSDPGASNKGLLVRILQKADAENDQDALTKAKKALTKALNP